MSNIPEAVKDYVFHYDKIEKLWCAIPKEKFSDYWKDPQNYDGAMYSGESVAGLLETISIETKILNSK